MMKLDHALLLPFLYYLTSADAELGKKSLDVAESQLADLIRIEQWDKPVCILFFKEGVSVKLTKKYFKIFDGWTRSYGQKLWHMRYYNVSKNGPSIAVKLDRLPSIYCFIGKPTHFHFSEKSSKLQKWLQLMASKSETGLNAMPYDNLEENIKKSQSKNALLFVIPGTSHFTSIYRMLENIPSESAEIILIPPNTPAERSMVENQGVKMFPTVLAFSRDKPGRKHSRSLKLEGPYNVNRWRILLLSIVLATRLPKLKEHNFLSTVVRHQTIPILVFFYTPMDLQAYEKLHAFERSFKWFQKIRRKEIRFGICDIYDPKVANEVAKYLPPTGLHEFPVIVIYQPSNDPVNGMPLDASAEVLQLSMPTPWQLEVALEELGVIKKRHEKATTVFDRHLFCSSNASLTCSPGDEASPIFGPEWDGRYSVKVAKRKIKKRRTIWNIPALNVDDWRKVFELSELDIKTTKTFDREFIKKASTRASSKIVLFIMANCHFCNYLNGMFQALHTKLKKQYTSSMFAVNCTSDPEVCSKNNVMGYPKLLLFRAFSSEETTRCFMKDSVKTNLRIDYDGDFQLDDILQWISSSSSPSVNIQVQDKNGSPTQKLAVQLTATVLTPAQARRYLPRSLEGKYFPFMCFKVLCERLYSTVDCVAAETALGVKESKIFSRKDLIVSEVLFRRQDGAEAFLFKLTRPMERTLNDNGDEKLHMFHKHHRYDLPRDFYCENDHGRCTETMYEYILDHHRLPITHITQESLHGRHKSDGHDAVFSKRLPVLIALIRSKREANGTFYTNFYEAASKLYLDVISAALDVDEYPQWASSFVPRNYHDSHKGIFTDATPGLFHYPRLCIFDWNNHSKAAFFPNIDEMEENQQIQIRLDNITSQEILSFAQKYLKNPDMHIIDTEFF